MPTSLSSAQTIRVPPSTASSVNVANEGPPPSNSSFVLMCLKGSLSTIVCDPAPTFSLDQDILAPTPVGGPSSVCFMSGSISNQADHSLKRVRSLTIENTSSGEALMTADRSTWMVDGSTNATPISRTISAPKPMAIFRTMSAPVSFKPAGTSAPAAPLFRRYNSSPFNTRRLHLRLTYPGFTLSGGGNHSPRAQNPARSSRNRHKASMGAGNASQGGAPDTPGIPISLHVSNGSRTSQNAGKRG